MINVHRIIEGCKHCIDKSGYYTNCVKCPYASEDDCTKQLRDDVIDVLKEYRLKLIAESCVGDYMTNYLKEKGATEEELNFFHDLREKYFVHHKSETNKEQPELPGISVTSSGQK